MNPFMMWLRSHPAERIALVIVGILVVAVVWQVAAHRAQPSASPSTAPTTAPTSVASSAPPPTATVTPGTTPGPAVLEAASVAAKGFLVAITTYRYDDTPATLGQRVRPLVTDQLYSQSFSRAADPTYNRHPELHEIDTPQVIKFTPEGYTPSGTLGFLARVATQVQTDNGTTTAPEQAYELFAQRQKDGSWRVSEFTGSVPGATS